MPLYEYGCPACGQVTEVRHGFDERPELKCERCGATLQRRFSAAPIVFKGSGFYVNDSRSSSGAKKSEKSESSDKPAAEAKPEPAKTDAPSTADGAGKKKSDEAAA